MCLHSAANACTAASLRRERGGPCPRSGVRPLTLMEQEIPAKAIPRLSAIGVHCRSAVRMLCRLQVVLGWVIHASR